MGFANNSIPRKDVKTALGSLEDVVAVMVKCANWHLHVDTASTLGSAKDSKCSINLAGRERTCFAPASSVFRKQHVVEVSGELGMCLKSKLLY